MKGSRCATKKNEELKTHVNIGTLDCNILIFVKMAL